MNEHYLKKELYDLITSDTSLFEFIQSGSLDGIWYWDLENPENEWMGPKFWETLGYNPSEKKHLASEWQDIIFQEDLKLAIENLEKHCSDPNHPYDQIVRYKHKNGSVIWIRCRGLAIRDEHGKAVRMLGAHTDITDLKETEKELAHANQTKAKLFSIIAHDLRSPFNGIFGVTEILAGEEYETTEEERSELMKELHHSAKGTYDLLTNLLDWSRLNLDGIEIHKEKIPVFEVIDQVRKPLSSFSDQKEIEIRCEGDRDLEVIVDRKSLELIVRNLLSNAIKYSHRGGTIVIHLMKEDTLGRIAVKDKGLGMSEAQISSIMEDGHHTSKPGTESEKGTGLGLNLVKDFVKKNDGTMNIQSQKGKGTSVELAFSK